MSNAYVTCTSGYSSVLSPLWSNNCDIELLLSDIPFISVGILAFGVSAFFLVIRRFTFSVLSLYFSVLLSFAAAIIDLTQTLIRDLSQVTIWPLITTREILLALSLGLRFLFYWLYVSEPPIGEQRIPSFRGGRSPFFSPGPQDELHSGNWARWGVAGSYAKFALLATIPAITALQITWRVFHRSYSPVYAVDVTLEVIISVLLLLKLLLNTLPASSTSRAHTFRECGILLLALILNVGISIGALVSFAFTESTVGRLLQGVELYILIVFMMIYHFFRHQRVPTVPNMMGLKVELPEQLRASTFRLSPPVVSTPIPEAQGRSVSTDAARHSVVASVSRATRWVSWRASRTQSNQDEDKAKLWDQSEAEKGVLGAPDTGQGSAVHRSVVSPASAMDERSTDIVNKSVPYSVATTMPDNLSVSTRSRHGSMSSEQIWNAIRVGVPRRSSKLQPPSLSIPVTTASSDGSGAAVIMTAVPEPPSQDSRIYELNGVTGQSPTMPRSSITSLDQFRELQSELDKIIATLRLFSPSSPNSPTSISSSRGDSNGDDDDDEQMHQSPAPVRQSSSTGRQSSSTTGARTVSDFSLSNFPSPPWLAAQVPSPPAPMPARIPRLKEDRWARIESRRDSSPDILGLPPPPRIPAALTDVPSSPRSDFTSGSPYQEDDRTLPVVDGRPSRFNSGGTQYEITSFIGDLSTPGGHRGDMGDMSLDEFGENPFNFAGIIEDSGFLEASPRLPAMPTRPSPLRVEALTGLPPSFARPMLSPLSMQERLLPVRTSEEHSRPTSDSREPAVQRGIRPLILPSMTLTPPLSNFESSSISSGATPMFGLPPRPGFRAPKPLPEYVQASGALGRPKPPPLILRSDEEYFAQRAE